MMTGVTSLFARQESAAPRVGFAGIDLAAYPNLVAAITDPSPSAPRDLFETTVRSVLRGLLTDDAG
ncbi:hypothetical protein GA0070216_11885 [Micromonospora matsumotoense]|uniref:Uncharacterized protein n=2 Tax=Micromonospora matsumotoense TaxID=121616 RepID=A0A1C5AK08_9ACTN|nr:hypothetical protein GA0070216_11885 [Micromonospora matsumotoense]